MIVDVTCPVCGTAEFDDIVSLHGLPVLINAQVRPDQGVAVQRGDVDLVVCLLCGHLYNRSFDPGLLDYDAAYENTLHYSHQFQTFARSLAERLVRDHALQGAQVGELGSGPGHFLSMLCEAGVERGFGWDPSYDPHRLGAPEHPSVTISADLFPDDASIPMRLAFSQHVLEHLDAPVAALAAQRSAVMPVDGVVYTEVPNGQLMIEHCALWDLIYEHRSYFVPSSLELACRRAGMRVTAVGTAFGDQFLWCESRPTDLEDVAVAQPAPIQASVAAAVAFGTAAVERIAQARNELEELASEGPVVLWGAGSKGATYLNLVADVADVAAVIDINPRKVGWGVPGTSLTVSDPEVLVTLQPGTVLAANPMYIAEIRQVLDDIGVQAAVRALWH